MHRQDDGRLGLKLIFRPHVPIVRIALVWEVAIIGIIRVPPRALVSGVSSRAIEVCVAAIVA